MEKETTLKHDPIAEYRDLFYRNREPKGALFHLPSGMLQSAIIDSAAHVPGVFKTEMRAFLNVIDLQIDFYGVPALRMDMVRSSGMNRTPDVRTRPCFEEWAFTATISFVKDRISEESVANLIFAAGEFTGVGDWRPQKSGNFGKFRVVSDAKDEKEFSRIVKAGGLAAQRAAYDRPVAYDSDTEELLDWYHKEIARRGKTSSRAVAKESAPRKRVKISEQPALNGAH